MKSLKQHTAFAVLAANLSPQALQGAPTLQFGLSRVNMGVASPVYLEIVDFIAAGTTPEAVMDFHPSREA
jgi:hypothetical protein